MSHTFAHLAGYKRLARMLLEEHRKNPERPIRRRTLEGFTEDEKADVVAALGRKHFEERGQGTIRVHVDRIVRDDFGGDEPRFWQSLKEASPLALASTPTQSADPVMMTEEIRSLPQTEARDYILELFHAKAWPWRAYKENGLDAAIAEIEFFINTAQALAAPLTAPTALKTFAATLHSDSHILDPGFPAFKRLTDYLARHDPLRQLGDERWRETILAEYNLYLASLGTVAYLSGPLTLIFADGNDDRIARNTRRGLVTALTVEEVAATKRLESPATHAITCEGPAKFVELCARFPDMVVVCTRGQPNSAVVGVVRLLDGAGIQIHHWGDTDVGGFRILRTLRRHAPIIPILMAAEAVRRHARKHLDAKKRAHIEANLRRLDAAAQHTLRACLEEGRWLEQETADVQIAIDHLASFGVAFQPRTGLVS